MFGRFPFDRLKEGKEKFIMNFFAKFRPRKKRIVEVYLKTLTDISMYTGIHSWDFISERQARPLTKLEPEQQQEAWQKVVETAPEGKITAYHVSKVVSEIRKETLVDFFIKSLGKIHSLGVSNKAIAKALNSYNCRNLLYAEIAPWTADDVSRILSASESGLILIN
jgi:predicted SnoaL-like aldol condensation-catalyzing enzyme